MTRGSNMTFQWNSLQSWKKKKKKLEALKDSTGAGNPW